MAEKRRELWRKQIGPIAFVAFDEDALTGCEVVDGSIVFHMSIRIATTEIRYHHASQADLEKMAEDRIMLSLAESMESALTELRAAIGDARRL